MTSVVNPHPELQTPEPPPSAPPPKPPAVVRQPAFDPSMFQLPPLPACMEPPPEPLQVMHVGLLVLGSLALGVVSGVVVHYLISSKGRVGCQ